MGTDVQTNKEVIIKLEPLDARNALLQYEAKVIKFLQGHQSIPEIYWHGVEGDFYVLIM
jgi:predicted Ser/Thr protein kinase